MALFPEVFETPRLRLRPLVADDAEALHRIQSDPEHMRFYPHPFSMQESVAWIERTVEHHAKHGFGLMAVEDRMTGEFLGNVGPMMQRVDDVDKIEIGWSITPDRARRGIATEAAKACRDRVFETVGVDHQIWLIRPENEPSRGVARNLGMTIRKQTIFGSVGWLYDVWRADRRDEAR